MSYATTSVNWVLLLTNIIVVDNGIDSKICEIKDCTLVGTAKQTFLNG